MEGWVDLGYPAMHRPGTELATSRSRVRRPTTTLTEQPVVTGGGGMWVYIPPKSVQVDYGVNDAKTAIEHEY